MKVKAVRFKVDIRLRPDSAHTPADVATALRALADTIQNGVQVLQGPIPDPKGDGAQIGTWELVVRRTLE